MSFDSALFMSTLEADVSLLGHLQPTCQLAADLLLKKVLSKFVSEVSSEADSIALGKFLAANEHCKVFELIPSDLADEYIIGEVKNELSRLIIEDPFDSIDFGPGACNGSHNCDLTDKLDGPWTTTSRWVYGQFVQALRGSPHFMNLASAKVSNGERPYKVVDGNKLCFVPKRNSESRVICCEPLINMCLQKSVENKLTSWLLRNFGIDLSTQQFRNRRQARRGSMDGEYSTIDLSSASDTIALSMLSQVLPAETFELLYALRSPRTKLPDGTDVELHMISSMGNATTFPLETIIFGSIVRAVYRLKNRSYDFCVFGDDIIVHKSCFNLTMKALRLFGFFPNREKTFNEGFFRESCGGDYYMGKNVRPVFITTARSKSDISSIINRLVIWSTRHLIPLPQTMEYLRSLHKELPLVPMYEQVDSGVWSFNPRNVGTYKALRPKDKKVPLSKRSESAKILAFLRGNIRNGSASQRAFFVRHKIVRLRSNSWNYLPADVDVLFEDTSRDNFIAMLCLYGFVV